MPLSRYQIRNEYSLADPELYRAADKDDPEALLEGVAMAGLVGVLRQLGDLAEFAAEIFHDLHEEVMATAARGHTLMVRIQQLESEFPPIEKAFLSQTNHSSFFYNAGTDWHPNLHMDQNIITRGDLPRFIMDSYEECRGPPRLFLLDKFDVAGAGACLKRYTDPSIFKVEGLSSGITATDVQREKKTRKLKKKGLRWKNGETHEALPTSHAKLHQLFLEERIENGHSKPARRVKLKRRLNGFPFDSKTGKSYMEKFLETSSLEHELIHEISVYSSPLKSRSNNSYESGLGRPEISSVHPEEELKQREGDLSPSVSEEGGASLEELDESPASNHILQMSNSNHDSGNFSSTLHVGVNEKEIAVRGESRRGDSIDGSQSDDIGSEIEKYVDALTTMESELDTDSELRAKNDLRFLNSKKMASDQDASDEQIQTHSTSDSQSMGNSTLSDDANSLPKKEVSSFSYSGTPSTHAESPPLGDELSVKALQTVEVCQPHSYGTSLSQQEVALLRLSEQAASNEVAVVPIDDTGKSITSLMDSDPIIEQPDTEVLLTEGAPVEPDKVHSAGKELETKFSSLFEHQAVVEASIDHPEQAVSNKTIEILNEKSQIGVSTANGSPTGSAQMYADEEEMARESALMEPETNRKQFIESKIEAENVLTGSETNILYFADNELETESFSQEVADAEHSPKHHVSSNLLTVVADNRDEVSNISEATTTRSLAESAPFEVQEDSRPLSEGEVTGPETDSLLFVQNECETGHIRVVENSDSEDINPAIVTDDLKEPKDDIADKLPAEDLNTGKFSPISSDCRDAPCPAGDNLMPALSGQNQHVDELGNDHLIFGDNSAFYSNDIDIPCDNTVDKSQPLAELNGENQEDPNVSCDASVDSMDTILEKESSNNSLQMMDHALNKGDSLQRMSVESEIGSPDFVTPQTEKQPLDLSWEQNILLDDSMKSDGTVSAVDIVVPEETAVNVTSIIESGKTCDEVDLQSSGITNHIPTIDLQEPDCSCSSQESFDELPRTVDPKKIDSSFDAGDLAINGTTDFTTLPDSASQAEVHVVYDEMGTALEQLKTVSTAATSSSTNANDVISPVGFTTLQQISVSSFNHSNANGLEDDMCPPGINIRDSSTGIELGCKLQDVDSVPFDDADHDHSKPEVPTVVFNQFHSSDVDYNLGPGDAMTIESPLQQNSIDAEEESFQHINHIGSSEVASTLLSHNIAGGSVELANSQLNEEKCLGDIEEHSEASVELKQIQHLDHISQDGLSDGSISLPSNLPVQTSVLDLLPQRTDKVDVFEHSQSPTLTSPGFDLLLGANPINLDEMPPLPPMPPVQWRMAKPHHMSESSEKAAKHDNLRPFSSLFPSTADQIGHSVIQSFPYSTVDKDLPVIQEDIPANAINSEPSLSQVTATVHQLDSEDSFVFRGGTVSMKALLASPGQLEPMQGLDGGAGEKVLPILTRLSQDTSADTVIHAPSSVGEEIPEKSYQVAAETTVKEQKPEESSAPYHMAPEITVEEQNPEKGPASSDVSVELHDRTEQITTDDILASGRSYQESSQPLHPVVAHEGPKEMEPGELTVSSEGNRVACEKEAPLPTEEDSQPQEPTTSLEGGIMWPVVEGGKQNGRRMVKLPRPRNPLIDAVAAHDKSKLRKVTERVVPQVQKADERDSLLDQIRNKSFNLRPALATRPSIQGPQTNLKVAAILEKAKTIRQAFAGSDEDDEDSWSDS